MRIPGLPSKSDIGHAICNPLLGRIIRTMWPMMEKGGVRLNLRNAAVPDQAIVALTLGLVERSERALVRRFIARDAPVIELGAGLGGVTLEIADTIDAQCGIMIVEANPALCAYWSENVKRSLRSRLRFEHAAISSDPSGTVSFSSDSAIFGSHVDQTGSAPLNVAAFNLEEAVRRSGFERYSLVCDIEGSEFEFMNEASMSCLDRCVSLVMELHPDERHKVEHMVQFLASAGLDVVGNRNNVYAFARTPAHSRQTR